MASDPGTIAELYSEERLRLWRRFQRRGVPAPAAADLVQESFVRLMRSQTDDIRDLRAYLYRVADSAEADMHRANMRSGRVIEADACPDEAVADPKPAVEAEMISREQREALDMAISELPPRAREVLFLHKFENLSYVEIGERLGISRNTVMVHMVRALSQLRQQLGGKDREAE